MSAATGLRRAGSTAVAGSMASRPALVFVTLFYLMVTAVLAGLWSSAANGNGGSIVGYSAAAFVWYIATSEASMVAIPIRLIEETGDDIGSGRIDVELLRPLSVLWLRVVMQVGAVLPRIGLCMMAGVVLCLIVAGPPPDGFALLLAAPSLVMAATLNIIAQHAFAGAAFWLRDAKSTWFLYQKLVFVLGGMLLPLEVLPGWLETTAKLLPFMAMSYVPGRLAAGYLEPWLLVVQVFWLAVVALAATRIYQSGERRIMRAGL